MGIYYFMLPKRSERFIPSSYWKGLLSVLIAAAIPQPTPNTKQRYHYYQGYFEWPLPLTK